MYRVLLLYLGMKKRENTLEKIIFENYDSTTKEFVKSELDLNQPTIDEFLIGANIENHFTKVGDIISDKKLNPKYRVNILPFFKKHKQWVYILTINKGIIKCGESIGTLTYRWGSYGAGTRVNRENGTCSTTNYFISEIIRVALSEGCKVELYGHPIENLTQKVSVFGETQKVVQNNVKRYESKLIGLFKETFGHLPVVGKNGLVE